MLLTVAVLHHWALSNTLHLRDLLFCFLHSPINRAHFPQDKDSSGDWNTRDVLSIWESLQTAISRCAQGLREENLLPFHTIYFLWAYREDVMPFVFEIQFYQTAVFCLNRKRAVFNYLPRALMIPPLIYLTYSWLCVFLFWKMQFGDEAFCHWHNLSVTDTLSLLSSWEKGDDEKEWREMRRRHTDRERKRKLKCPQE